LSILKTGKARGIRFATLEAICEALDCQPGDLLQYRREEPEDEAVRADASERAQP
jgi:putative transcriptional regulator